MDAAGIRTEYAYDTRNRLTQASYKNGSGTPVNDATNATRSYTYDLAGNLLAVTELAKSGKADVAYTYDGLRRILTETSGGLTHVYKYDLAGNRVYCLYGGLSVPLVSTYDEQNRLATLTQGASVTAYTYDLNGNTLTRVLPNGDATSSSYDALNRTTSLAAVNSGSNVLYSYAYQFDAVSNVRQVTENYSGTALNRVVTNTYDDINRLTEEAVTGGGSGTTTFTYDDTHNRATMVKSGTTTSYSYNNANQLTQAVTGTNTASFTYDDNGNRITSSISSVKFVTAGELDDASDFYREFSVGQSKASLAGIGMFLTPIGWEKGAAEMEANMARNIINGTRLRNQLIGQEIAGGHAFMKHAAEFGFKTPAEMAAHIERVVSNPSAVRSLTKGRVAYWDAKTQSVVIRNPTAKDGGTAFVPTEGKAYFDNLK